MGRLPKGEKPLRPAEQQLSIWLNRRQMAQLRTIKNTLVLARRISPGVSMNVFGKALILGFIERLSKKMHADVRYVKEMEAQLALEQLSLEPGGESRTQVNELGDEILGALLEDGCDF